MRVEPADGELLWLETLQLVTARAAHELKGALNGVSVNLEVVRGRAAQPDLAAAAVARFATSAATQLDHVIEMNEALLALVRRPREPADVAATLRQLAALLVPAATAGGTTVAIDVSGDALPVGTAAPGHAVRAVLGRVLLALIDGGGGEVRVRAEDGGVVVDAVASGRPIVLEARVAATAAAAGIRFDSQGLAFTLTFPSPAVPLARRGAATHGIA